MEPEVHSGDQNQAAEPLLALTDKAVEMLKQEMAQAGKTNAGIRMTVAGGGCEGFEYSLKMEAETRPDDVVIAQDGIRALLDPVSAQRLQGTLLDYVTNRYGTGFHFFGLDAVRTIGCGSPILLRRCMAGNTRTRGCFESAKRPLLKLQDAAPEVVGTSSISHPGMRPLQKCPTCLYIVCRCEKPN
ncbi:MAG: iron-sulfur cluster assembly accessory protein [Deltaproteobacteria bacterium]|nr:iron-sulfur cluster assembly accessory protein [Deltaproteobacteria bacterium]